MLLIGFASRDAAPKQEKMEERTEEEITSLTKIHAALFKEDELSNTLPTFSSYSRSRKGLVTHFRPVRMESKSKKI